MFGMAYLVMLVSFSLREKVPVGRMRALQSEGYGLVAE
jgi:hypothetical protein